MGGMKETESAIKGSKMRGDKLMQEVSLTQRYFLTWRS